MMSRVQSAGNKKEYNEYIDKVKKPSGLCFSCYGKAETGSFFLPLTCLSVCLNWFMAFTVAKAAKENTTHREIESSLRVVLDCLWADESESKG